MLDLKSEILSRGMKLYSGDILEKTKQAMKRQLISPSYGYQKERYERLHKRSALVNALLCIYDL